MICKKLPSGEGYGSEVCTKAAAPNERVCVRQYCAEIVEARNRTELIVRSLAKRNGVTENQMEWVRQMNACKAQAEEIVKAELIYD